MLQRASQEPHCSDTLSLFPPWLVPASVYKRTRWLVRSPKLFLNSRGDTLGLSKGIHLILLEGLMVEKGVQRSPLNTIQFGMVRCLLRVYITVLSQLPQKPLVFLFLV